MKEASVMVVSISLTSENLMRLQAKADQQAQNNNDTR